MEFFYQAAIAAVAAVTFAGATAQSIPREPGHAVGAGHGPTMATTGSGMGHGTGQGAAGRGPVAMLTRQDPNSSADMAVVMDLVRDGMAGMHRGMMSRMAMGSGGPRAMRGATRDGEASTTHQHQH